MPSVLTQVKLGFRSPGSPNSQTESNWKRKNLVKAEAIKPVKTLWVHKSIYAQVNALCIYLQANGARLGENVDDWGFANRDVRGFAGIKSYHSWALAIDLDATENPLGKRKTSFAKNLEDLTEVREVCKMLGFRWGFDYTGRPDPMHFEFIKSRIRARIIKRKLLKPTKKSRRLAKLCDMPVETFCTKVGKYSKYPY